MAIKKLLFKELDLSIKSRDIYFSKKEKKLSELKNSRNNSESLLDQFQISQELMQEYYYHIYIERSVYIRYF